MNDFISLDDALLFCNIDDPTPEQLQLINFLIPTAQALIMSYCNLDKLTEDNHDPLLFQFVGTQLIVKEYRRITNGQIGGATRIKFKDLESIFINDDDIPLFHRQLLDRFRNIGFV